MFQRCLPLHSSCRAGATLDRVTPAPRMVKDVKLSSVSSNRRRSQFFSSVELVWGSTIITRELTLISWTSTHCRSAYLRRTRIQ